MKDTCSEHGSIGCFCREGDVKLYLGVRMSKIYTTKEGKLL